MPRYSFLLTRFVGGSVRQGLRQGATPDSSCLMMDSVTISYAVGICVLLLYVRISFSRMVQSGGLREWGASRTQLAEFDFVECKCGVNYLRSEWLRSSVLFSSGDRFRGGFRRLNTSSRVTVPWRTERGVADDSGIGLRQEYCCR